MPRRLCPTPRAPCAITASAPTPSGGSRAPEQDWHLWLRAKDNKEKTCGTTAQSSGGPWLPGMGDGGEGLLGVLRARKI